MLRKMDCSVSLFPLDPGLQAMRNLDDLETMACPPKYRAMQTFWKYYNGQAKAPYPTLFGEAAVIFSSRCRI